MHNTPCTSLQLSSLFLSQRSSISGEEEGPRIRLAAAVARGTRLHAGSNIAADPDRHHQVHSHNHLAEVDIRPAAPAAEDAHIRLVAAARNRLAAAAAHTLPAARIRPDCNPVEAGHHSLLVGMGHHHIRLEERRNRPDLGLPEEGGSLFARLPCRSLRQPRPGGV